MRIPWTAKRSNQSILKNIRVPWWLCQPVSAAGDWAASAAALAVFSGSWGSLCHLHTCNRPAAPYFRVRMHPLLSSSRLAAAGSCCFTFPHVETAGPAGHLRLFAAPSPASPLSPGLWLHSISKTMLKAATYQEENLKKTFKIKRRLLFGRKL